MYEILSNPMKFYVKVFHSVGLKSCVMLMSNEKLVKLFKWETNPFTFQIFPELFVGYEKEVNKLIHGLENGNKISLLLGPTGSGKTTLLKHLYQTFSNEKYIIYLSKPPKNPKDWITIFRQISKPNFIKTILFRNNGVNLYNLHEWTNKQIKNKKFILFVDESHEASLESLEWLRVFADQIDSLSVVLAALPVFEDTMKSKLETFMRRVSIKIELTNLTKSETRELIKRRIESIGGEDIKPFTHGTIDYIYEKTGGFPREIIRVCNQLIQKAMEKNISIIDTDFLKEIDMPEPRISLEKITMLPERQRLILETLSKHGELTPSELIQKMDTEDYKDKDNAVRSVNNLLRRLMSEKFVERKKFGKAYKYKLGDRFKTLLVKT